MSKRTILKGTIILTIAGIATKLLGFYNRIFLTRVIGVRELGIYQLIFPLYLLAFSFCSQGISTALTKQIAYYIGKHESCNAKKVFRTSICISFILSIIASSVITIFSDSLAKQLLKNSDCAPLLRIIAVAVPFVAIKACINSYFVGMSKAFYQGFSHFIEQIIRIGSAMLLVNILSKDMVNAGMAVIAVVIGEISATIIAVIFYLNECRNERKKTNKQNRSINVCAPCRNIVLSFVRDAVPLTANNLMFTLFSSLEAIIMPAMLYYYYMDSDTAIEMFGIVTGIVVPFLLFPATITTSLSTMLLPAVSFAHAKNDENTINLAMKNSVLFCLLLGTTAWIGYMLLGEWACTFAFKSKEAGILLKKMSYLCPLIYLSSSLSAILNGLDKTFKNLIYNIISITIRIVCSVVFVPRYGITAYIVGMTVSYATLDLMLLREIR